VRKVSDIVICHHLLEHLEKDDFRMLLQKIHKALRQNGVFLIGIPINEKSIIRKMIRIIFTMKCREYSASVHKFTPTLSELISELYNSGFSVQPDEILSEFYFSNCKNLHRVPLFGDKLLTVTYIKARKVVL